jgi:hypothetical protein
MLCDSQGLAQEMIIAYRVATRRWKSGEIIFEMMMADHDDQASPPEVLHPAKSAACMFGHPHNLRILSTMVRRPTRFQQGHATEFGLVVLTLDLQNRVNYVRCEFCQCFAREARDGHRTLRTVQHYRPPFRRAQFVSSYHVPSMR